MKYCTAEDIATRIIRRYPDAGYFPEASRLVVGTPGRRHSQPGWCAIGLLYEVEANSWAILTGLMDEDGYRPLWDVYANRELVEEELAKACKGLGGVYAKGY